VPRYLIKYELPFCTTEPRCPRIGLIPFLVAIRWASSAGYDGIEVLVGKANMLAEAPEWDLIRPCALIYPRSGEIAMTSLQRRLRKLEAITAPVHALVVPERAAAMRESRLRRAEAEGTNYVDPEPVVVDDPNDWASVMRACRARRAAEAQRNPK
jgi:hypothetical protein